jgi:hypothetical protein
MPVVQTVLDGGFITLSAAQAAAPPTFPAAIRGHPALRKEVTYEIDPLLG